MAGLKAGVAVVDITPPPGLFLAGFAARSHSASGVHDSLTVRALVLGDTAIVVADVIGIQSETSRAVREKCCLPAEQVIITATHTHGAPNSMPGRLGSPANEAFVRALEGACVSAVEEAVRTAVPATIRGGYGADPDVARNRRHHDGVLDRTLPVLEIAAGDGRVMALVTSYACHPTVLGADNLLMTADFPHYVRRELEAAHPGAVALFLTGCAGDANIGHSASASWTITTNISRTFDNAERLGRKIGRCALAADLLPVDGVPRVLNATVSLALDRPEGDLNGAADGWERELKEGVAPPRSVLLPHWIAWARANAATELKNWDGRVSVIDLGAAVITAAPGEVFAATGLAIRAACRDRLAFVLGYADDTPGYIPPQGEYDFGGYEVDEAHRFVGLPGRFAKGSAEMILQKTTELLDKASAF